MKAVTAADRTKSIEHKARPRFFYENASGKLAIKARLDQQRAGAKRANSLNENVSNRMDAALARVEAERLETAPDTIAKAHGEVVDLGDLGFISAYLFDTLENPDMVGVDASEQRMYLAAGAGVLQAAVDTAKSASAENSIEKMLCHQLAAAHCSAMKMISYSYGGTFPAAGDRTRFANAAARMMQVFQEGLLTLQKLRTGGKQTLVVQHVNVSEGGQAVIAGSVKSGSRNGHNRGRGAKCRGNTP